MIHRRVERCTRALDAPHLDLVGPVEIDEMYVSAGLKGREGDQPSHSRGQATRGGGSYGGDKSPVFTIVDRGTEDRYVIPAKSADESTVRLLLADRQLESLTINTDGFRAYEPLEEDDDFDREYVVHSDGEYAAAEVHINTCESHGRRSEPWLSPPRSVSKYKLTQYLRAFQVRRELCRKPGKEALKHAIRATL
jgi:transposase-like protein